MFRTHLSRLFLILIHKSEFGSRMRQRAADYLPDTEFMSVI